MVRYVFCPAYSERYVSLGLQLVENSYQILDSYFLKLWYIPGENINITIFVYVFTKHVSDIKVSHCRIYKTKSIQSKYLSFI